MHPTAARRLGLLVPAALVVAIAWVSWPWSGEPAAPDAPQAPGAGAADATPAVAAAAAGNPAVMPGPAREAVVTDRADKATEVPTARASARLVDAQGHAVAGQQVELQVGIDKAPGDARVRRLGADTVWSPGEQATSGADGGFVLHVPLGAAARVAAVAGEWVFRQGPLEFPPQFADTVLGDIVVQRACVVAGVVRDVRGAPCKGVAVLCGADSRSFDEGRAAKVETGDDGSFHFGALANGSYRLLCRSPQYVPQSRTVALLPEQQLLDVAFALATGGNISGRVVDDTGAPVADADVRAQHMGSDVALARARSAADGTFLLGGLVDASCQVSARCKGHRDKTTPAYLGARDVALRLVRAAAIAGVVVDAAGAPVPSSRVRAVPTSQSAEKDRSQLLFNPGVVAGADGRFALNDLAPGDYRVLAYGAHLDAAVTPVHAEPGNPVDLTIQVQRGGVVRVAVQAPDGAPVAGARVRVAEQSVPEQDKPMVLIGASDFDPELLTLGQRVSRATTDAQGIAPIPGLEAGTYRVRVTADAGVQEQPALVTVPAAEEVAMNVKLTSGGFARFEVVDARSAPVPKKRVEIEGPLDGGGKGAQTGSDCGADGTLRLGPLVPGRYTAAIGKPVNTDAFGGGVLVTTGGGPSLASTRVEFTARAGETVSVHLVLPYLATLRGTLRDTLGPIADGNVQIGAANPDRTAGARHGLDGSTRSARTRPDGSFAIADLEPGSYRVRYGKAKQDLLAECSVMVGASGAPLDLLVQCGTLRITAQSASDQKPLSGVRATLQRAADTGTTSDPAILDYAFPQSPTAEVRTDAAGVAQFADVPFGSYVVEVRAAAHRTTKSAVVALDAATTDAGVVELQAAGRITGTFADATGPVQIQAYVEYRRVDATDFQPGFAGRGKFEIDGLEPGDYVVRARRLGGAPGAGMLPPGPETTVHVQAGAVATVTLQLAAQ